MKVLDSRRKFIRNTLGVGSMLPFMSSMHMSDQIKALGKMEEPRSGAPLKILILGGTSFLGPHQIKIALDRGHSVTTFTRGKTKPKIFPEIFENVESLIGDRENNLEALKGRKWDVVIDNSGRKVQWTEDTAKLLKGNVGMYQYVSSVSVNYPFTGDDFSEKRKLVLEMPKDLEEGEKPMYDYGIMKANSELAASKHFGASTMVVRPHLIVGPGDPTDRFTYWPLRLSLGGETLIPGADSDNVQFIDVRDLASWMINCAESLRTGTYNAAGPANPLSMAAFVHGIHAAFSAPISYVYIKDHKFLIENNFTYSSPWILPRDKFSGMCITDNDKFVETGLQFTPLAKTALDTYEWFKYDLDDNSERMAKMLFNEESLLKREVALIEKWRSLGN